MSIYNIILDSKGYDFQLEKMKKRRVSWAPDLFLIFLYCTRSQDLEAALASNRIFKEIKYEQVK
jgi:hypothetical protein